MSYSNYKTVVVDNGSKGNDAEYLKKEFGDFIYIIKNDKNYGYAEGNNIGIRYALKNDADYILLLNNDITVNYGFLDELIRVAESDPRIGFVGSMIYYYHKPNIINFAGGKTNFQKGLTPHIGVNEEDRGQYDKVTEMDYVMSPLVKRKVLEGPVGLMDPLFFLYFEEVDWQVRAKKMGYKVVFTPHAKMWHKIGRSTTDLTKLYYMLRNRTIFMRKHAKKGELFAFLLFYFFVHIPTESHKLFLKMPFQTTITIIKSVSDGLKTKVSRGGSLR